jgi:formamidopyrimidine-DNA glycosylase
MPELPEVETIARTLRMVGLDFPPLMGSLITGAELFWLSTLFEPEPAVFIRQIIGEEILGIGRRGKFLVFSLSHYFLLIHLRMSGNIRVGKVISEGQPIQKHDRLVLSFSNHLHLAFNDPRKFGRVWLVHDKQSVLGRLGPEPLDMDFLPCHFHARLSKHRRQLKPLLMDQTVLAGLGNIYTDESLFRANLHPCYSSNHLNENQSYQLLESIRNVLLEGINRNGSSIDWVYRGGDFQNNFKVYQRTGLPCLVCGSPIERKVIGQRSTHFCPVCQFNS